MPYEFYKVLHIVGLIMAVGAIGAIAFQAFLTSDKKFPLKKAAIAFHGVGVLLVFVSGFGLMARIGLVGQGWPNWILFKLGIWLFVLGIAPTLAMRLPKVKLWFWWLIPALLTLAVIAAVYKTRFI